MFTQAHVIGHMTDSRVDRLRACTHVHTLVQSATFPALPANYEVMEGKPAWASQYSLKPIGTYYEGFVEDVDSLLAKFQAETVTTFGIRRSRYTDSDSSDRVREPSENKENEKVNIL